MADMVATLELDDKRFRDGIERAERSTGKLGSNIERSLGATGSRLMSAAAGYFSLSRGIQFVSSTVSEYAEKYSWARSETDAFDASIQKVKDSMGADFTSLIAGAGSEIDDLSAKLFNIQNFTADVIKTILTGKNQFGEAEASNEAKRKLEQQDGRFKAMETQKALLADMNAETERLLGNEEEAAKIAGQRADQDFARRIGQMRYLTGAERQELSDARDRRKAAAEAKAAADRQKAAQKLADDDRRAREEAARDIAQFNAENMAKAGDATGSELLKLQIEQEERLAKLRANQALSAEERADFERKVNAQFVERRRLIESEAAMQGEKARAEAAEQEARLQREAEADRARSTRWASLATGQSEGIMAQAFGPAGGMAISRETSGVGLGAVVATGKATANHTRETKQILERIEGKMGKGWAVFA